MTALPDPADLAPSRDPADYGRRSLFSASFWAMIALCVLCVLAGAAVVYMHPAFVFGRPVLTAPQAAAASGPAAEQQTAPAGAASSALAAASDASAGVSALSDRVARVEAGQARLSDAAAVALATAALSDAAAQPRPFEGALAAFERVLPASADAYALRPLAAQGAPTRAALAAELSQLSGDIAVAARAPGPDAGILAQAGYLISRVVSVRRVDGGGTGADASLAKALLLAADGDVEGAAALLDTLPTAARDRLAPWRLRAGRRIEIDRHLANLRTQALAGLTQSRRPPA